MFTQCPECQIAFRVTAKVLQQAEGNVRCGGCGHAFNALHYLSEEMPGRADADDGAAEAPADELAETSRRLLATLDELAGPGDVRIEDTGVEWRVLDSESGDDGDPDTAVGDEPRYDDNTPLPDDYGDEPGHEFVLVDTQSERRTVSDAAPRDDDIDERPEEPEEPEEPEDRQAEFALSEPDDWADILEEVSDPGADLLEVEEELAAIHNELASKSPAVDDGQSDERAADGAAEPEGMEIRFGPGEDGLTDEVPLLGDVEGEPEPEEEQDSLVERIETDDAFLAVPDDTDDADTGVFEAPFAEDDDSEEPSYPESTGEFESQIDLAARAFDEAETDDDEADLDRDATDWAPDDAFEEPPTGETEHVVPEPTEEEMTVNMEIDAELMAAADTDQDLSRTFAGIENPEELFDENSGEVETIIMEGEFVRSAVEKERLAAENAARSQLDDPASLADTYALSRGKVRGGRRRYDPPSARMIAAVVTLGLLLAAQIIHNSRKDLATYGFFNSTIAPVYRVLGNPVSPAWDIRGWQFEATNGSVDAEETALTIVSRIANRSGEALPYPLIHVSLTDRWEEVIGSRMLEPAEYLAGGIDPSRPVPPADDFTAVMTIENPAEEATGFKLNVCYRVEPATVRCAIEDFKD